MAIRTERRLFTVQEYHRMGEAGVLAEDERVELIEGEIVTMPPIGEGHARSVDGAAELLITRLGQRARVRIQGPVDVGQRSEFQPDLAVLRREPACVGAEHPGPDDILLIIEVADTSLERDRGLKLPVYARAGVGEVWIVNLRAGLIEVYRQPGGGAYRDVSTVGRGERLTISAIPDVGFATDEILG
ncbi:MAG: Uma2 family endonuclease [Candidatus Rokubacteria bacterium]|nr:Uma2 family endonuclease [Candidatus Rokubacteria bacterium]